MPFPEEIFTATDREALELQLDAQRGEIADLLDGLTEEETRRRLVPSLTTVLGLVKHATFVEQVWFHSRVAGVDRHELGIPDEIDDSFRLGEQDTIASVREAYDEACAHSRRVTAEHDLEEEFPWHRGPVSLRFVYVHCIQELARHAGHGDILREQLIAAR
ncbi:MAG TPA: DinB family protein [Marmoricola sp.]|nr:DinB family protein [Marmoricola sp.]